MVRQFWCGAAALLALAPGAAADDKAAAQAGFARFKQLAGTWVAADDQGKPTDQVIAVYKVTAARRAVHETLRPGGDHEMVTVFHLDGPNLVLTHYCAAGNQ